MRFIVQNDTTGEQIEMHDQRLYNASGVWLTTVEGWFGTPQPREQTISRAFTDGDFQPEEITQGARTINLGGHGCFKSSIECALFMDRVNALVCTPVTIINDSASGLRYMQGYVSDEIEPTLRPDEISCDFELVITCADPFKYGRPRYFSPTGAFIIVDNEGNTNTYPQIHVDGPVTTLLLELNGQQILWSGSADSLDIDTRDMLPDSGTITLDNAFTVPPGISAITASSDGQITLTVSPAWR